MLADPDLSGTAVAGSGVVTNTVLVQLIDSANGIVSGSPQLATVTGSDWTVDYMMSGMAPHGVYTIAVSLEDVVGNGTTIAEQSLLLDERPPSVDVAPLALPKIAISQTMTITGTASELPNWGSGVVEHHFEEPVGSTLFYNTTSSQFYTVTHSTCIACPTAEQPSLFGVGVQFDGVDDVITIPYVITPTAETFAATVWFKATDLASTRTILQQEDGNGNGRSWLMVEAGNLSTDLGGSVLTGTTSITANEWHHAAVTYNGEILRSYLNGRLEASEARTIEISDGDWLLGVDKSGANRFIGMMDEFNLYDRALVSEEVYGLVQTESYGVASVQVALQPANFVITETVAPSSYVDISVDNVSQNFSQWQYTLPNNLGEGFYELYVRAVDVNNAIGRDEMVWRGLVDMVSPTITVTGQHTWQDGLPVTAYSFSFNDFILDESSYDQPCATGDLVTQTYNDANIPNDGLPYEVSAICQVATHEASRDFTVCDTVGHCTTVTANAVKVPQVCGVSENQAYDFDDLTIFIEPGGLGDIDCLQASHVEMNYPAATAGIQTGAYWMIDALTSSKGAASTYTTTLTTTVSFIPDADDKLCRYTGTAWDCATDSFDAGNQTITRNNVTAFSPWAVGNDVGPTAVTLHSVSASSSSQLWMLWFVILALLMGVITAVVWWRRRKSVNMEVRL